MSKAVAVTGRSQCPRGLSRGWNAAVPGHELFEHRGRSMPGRFATVVGRCTPPKAARSWTPGKLYAFGRSCGGGCAVLRRMETAQALRSFPSAIQLVADSVATSG